MENLNSTVLMMLTENGFETVNIKPKINVGQTFFFYYLDTTDEKLS